MLELLKQSSNPEICRPLAEAVKEKAKEYYRVHGRKPAFMEVCGSHTMALARSGVKQALLNEVNLISGPGCPVCVTDQKSIDAMIALAEGEGRIICTFGDMMRVPGSRYTLMSAKTAGKDIRVLYSPMEAIKIAEQHPDKEIVFLGVGFETTIPILSLLIGEADQRGLGNFSIWMATKLVEPILRYLLDQGETQIDGFLLPGHVSIVLGEGSYSYLADEYNISGVITGFEPAELLSGIYKLIDIAASPEAKILNDHKSIVTKQGNIVARKWMATYFTHCDEAWRGIGIIPKSGLDFKPGYERYNAKKRFNVRMEEPRKTKCRCGEVIRGLVSPNECSLFGKACKPLNPIGPCMVSAEGSCSAYYQYMRESI
ncbi:hydrogenase formation protein HypD [Mesobacillus subterraneus]|uniref:hydrogenase formation protein HypD n=1 Tax=Mesobacillus subterraneus TaxID=285983 RepID=UPI00204068A4|nr:hydrogenase formation protein HypD [Mesobacillus subterraneus]MCM3664379.1 hydrogenase formation protein HypD [Mesobacillus subterraneus]MCM3682405.1 hydrogenase formation protein HypD [Mesobacillus subterraneus]